MNADLSHRLAQLSEEYLADLFETYPTLASSLGLHDYDGRIPDVREPARQARAGALRGFAARLSAIPPDRLDAEDAHDHTLLRLAAEEELFDLEVLRDFERSPLAYSGTVDVSGYVKRAYAPLERRVASLIEHLRQIPGVFAAARATLRPPLPRPFIETARDVYAGTIQYHREDLPAAVRPVGAGALWSAFEHANAEAIAALEAFLAYLDEQHGRAGAEFAIGPDRFATMLRLGEMVDLPLDRLREIGAADLAGNAARLTEICGRLAPGVPVREVIRRQSRDHPDAARLVAEAARTLAELRTFIETHGIVTIPSDAEPIVEETPPFARWAFAMMDTAGPFETSSESFYYVTPPERGWTPEQTEEWLTKFDYATLRDVGIHEVYPGHFVHFLHVKHVPRRVRQVLTSYAFVEGWAHGCEEMMLDAGFRPDDGALRVAQLAEALLRNVRFVVAIDMHTRGLGVEEAARRFVEHAHLALLPAEKEAVRGTFDPGYLNYTLGKLMLRKLQADVRAQAGAGFSLRSFNDGLLALGAPPVPLARRRMLENDSGVL